jgi:hypothetical protein
MTNDSRFDIGMDKNTNTNTKTQKHKHKNTKTHNWFTIVLTFATKCGETKNIKNKGNEQ